MDLAAVFPSVAREESRRGLNLREIPRGQVVSEEVAEEDCYYSLLFLLNLAHDVSEGLFPLIQIVLLLRPRLHYFRVAAGDDYDSERRAARMNDSGRAFVAFVAFEASVAFAWDLTWLLNRVALAYQVAYRAYRIRGAFAYSVAYFVEAFAFAYPLELDAVGHIS